VPADMQQTSLPSRHKEIVQQTEWQYLSAGKIEYQLSFLNDGKNLFSIFCASCSSSYYHSIFHPPCFS